MNKILFNLTLTLLTTSTLHLTTACGDDEDGSAVDLSAFQNNDTANNSDANNSNSNSDDADPLADRPNATPDQAFAYCECMFMNCHDTYHEVWSEDETAAQRACLAEGETLKSLGEETETGPAIECRQAFCEKGFTDLTQCEAAAGLETCVAE